MIVGIPLCKTSSQSVPKLRKIIYLTPDVDISKALRLNSVGG